MVREMFCFVLSNEPMYTNMFAKAGAQEKPLATLSI